MKKKGKLLPYCLRCGRWQYFEEKPYTCYVCGGEVSARIKKNPRKKSKRVFESKGGKVEEEKIIAEPKFSVIRAVCQKCGQIQQDKQAIICNKSSCRGTVNYQNVQLPLSELKPSERENRVPV